MTIEIRLKYVQEAYRLACQYVNGVFPYLNSTHEFLNGDIG